MTALVTLWHNGKPVRMAKLDALAKKHTAFSSFTDMALAFGNYRPSLAISGKGKRVQCELTLLADAYDAMQEYHGDTRRAFRS